MPVCVDRESFGQHWRQAVVLIRKFFIGQIGFEIWVGIGSVSCKQWKCSKKDCYFSFAYFYYNQQVTVLLIRWSRVRIPPDPPNVVSVMFQKAALAQLVEQPPCKR